MIIYIRNIENLYDEHMEIWTDIFKFSINDKDYYYKNVSTTKGGDIYILDEKFKDLEDIELCNIIKTVSLHQGILCAELEEGNYIDTSLFDIYDMESKDYKKGVFDSNGNLIDLY